MFERDGGEQEELVRCFITESRELLDNAEPQIIAMEEKALEQGLVDEEILNTIFRLFHSLKGSASFLDLQTVINVTHEAETLLDIFRKGRAAVLPGHVDVLIRTSDFIRNILDTVEANFTDEGFEGDAGVIIQDLKDTITMIFAQPEPASPSLQPVGPTADFTLTDEMIPRFAEENLPLLDEVEEKLLEMEKDPGNLERAADIFRNIHSLKGNAGFFGYGDLERLSHHAETLLDRIRQGLSECSPVAVSILLVTVDALREGIHQVEGGSTLDIPGMEEMIRYLDNLVGPEKESEHQATAVVCEEKPQQRDSAAENEVPLPSRAVEKKPLPGQEVIRVDIDKLDKLLDLVGELVIAEAMVVNNQELAGKGMDRFEKAALQLEKITRDIQEVAMAMRMIPLSGTFRKMVRLVRDLAQKEGKKINLEIIGEETEVDKTIIEQISDPLVHLIRNAVDHGIEEPAQRAASGKPEVACLTLGARHSGGEVWITVEDDGRGLNREQIRRKAVDLGLISPDEGSEPKGDELLRLIFEPGFSTAEQVSNISGRGVGMDVVKRNIERLHGKVDIRTKPGLGTMFVVRIPLTLAIIEGMVVRVGDSRYTVPINSIRESLQPSIDQVTTTPDGQELVLIRGELIPVVRLHELYRVKAGCLDLAEGILVVVEADERKCGLFVDEVLGQQQIVIKGLSGYLGRVRSMSGCAILGDGDISLILDVGDLIDSVQTRTA